MAKSLGLYIEDNVIKYAKVSKERDNIKVESFGMEFFENLQDAIRKVIEESGSQKLPICVNLKNEKYNEFKVFSLLAKSDRQKAIATEFETLCETAGDNANNYETRYIESGYGKNDQTEVMHVSAKKVDIGERTSLLAGYKVTNLVPLPMVIPNLLELAPNENSVLIVNIEKNTTVTTVINGKVRHVDFIKNGSEEILEKLNSMENSYSKAYEICKNTTIYTSMSSKEMQSPQDIAHVEAIMPSLHTIVSHVKHIADRHQGIQKVYITGTGSMVNNADIYFQEYLEGIPCETLRPYFIKTTRDMTIKDYQEVNSATALALYALGIGPTELNFKGKGTTSTDMSEVMKMDISVDTIKEFFGSTRNDLGEEYSKGELILLRIVIALLLIFLVYSSFSALLNAQIEQKKQETVALQNDISEQIALASSDNDRIKTRTNDYSDLIDEINEQNERIEDANQTRNSIPDLLNDLMYVIPEQVRMSSIEQNDEHVVIYAQSDKYEQLGYYKAKIKSDGILLNVTSSGGVKENDIVTIKIEGDLP